jgi:hypothetical protein
MTIKALVYGGVQITGITPPKAASQYDGVYLQFSGSTFQQGQWRPAGMTIDMNQSDALDLALALILAAEKHGNDAGKAVPNLVRRLQRRMNKKGGA